MTAVASARLRWFSGRPGRDPMSSLTALIGEQVLELQVAGAEVVDRAGIAAAAAGKAGELLDQHYESVSFCNQPGREWFLIVRYAPAG